MSTKVVSLLLLLSALAMGNTKLFPRATADDTEKVVAAVVEGVVYCQKCKYVGSWNLGGARPLPSAKVSVTCKDHKRRVVLYRRAEADANGYFHTLLEGAGLRRSAYFDPATACTVRLLASPDANCNRLTNVNYGIGGARLRYENKTIPGEHPETDLYAAGPLAFKPVHCHPRTRY